MSAFTNKKIYSSIIFLTYNETPEILEDTIKNLHHFTSNTFIIVNNGTDVDLDHFNSNNVHILKHSFKLSHYHDTKIPQHILMKDYLIENNIFAEYIFLIANNQLFIKHGFEDFTKSYTAGFFDRPFDLAHMDFLNTVPIFMKYMNMLGSDKFIYHSNHDGMFFRYDDFINMMCFFDDYRDQIVPMCNEEFLYIAYLMTFFNESEFARFSQYNGWTWENNATLEFYDQCENSNLYLIKRVGYELKNNIRHFIKLKNGY